MGSITGAKAKMGLKVATTWGTAVAAGAGNGFIAEATWSDNGQVLTPRAIGSGKVMKYSATLGAIVPTVSLTGEFGYRNNWDVLFAVFFGTAGAPSEQNVGESDYLHTVTFNTTRNAKYLTLGWEDSTTTTIEFPTCTVRSIGLKSTTVPGYLEATAELLASKAEFSSSTNTNVTLASATQTDSELAVIEFGDPFWVDDASSIALASGDQYAITAFDFAMTQPQDIIPEIKGSSGNGTPTISDLASGTFNVTVKELADHAYYTAWVAETVKKALVSAEGTQIGAGDNKKVALYLPNLKLLSAPSNPFTSAGINGLSLNFEILAASSAPTGMGSVYPYLEITNGLSTSLLA